MLKRNYESIPKISPIFWIIFQKYRHFSGIGGFSWEQQAAATTPPLYPQCHAARTLSGGGRYVSFQCSRAPSGLQGEQCRCTAQENSLRSGGETNEGTRPWDSSCIWLRSISAAGQCLLW